MKKPATRPKAGKTITTIRLKNETLARLTVAAANRGISRNALLQQIADRFLRTEGVS